jgi:hypothetical protein
MGTERSNCGTADIRVFAPERLLGRILDWVRWLLNKGYVPFTGHDVSPNIPNTDAPVVFASGQLAATGRARVCGEALNLLLVQRAESSRS